MAIRTGGPQLAMEQYQVYMLWTDLLNAES